MDSEGKTELPGGTTCSSQSPVLWQLIPSCTPSFLLSPTRAAPWVVCNSMPQASTLVPEKEPHRTARDERWLSAQPRPVYRPPCDGVPAGVNTRRWSSRRSTTVLFTPGSLKPLLLMGHYDVVHVAALSVDQWTHPTYSGYFDGEFDRHWGSPGEEIRASRTVVLSFGFDEEAGGLSRPSLSRPHLATYCLQSVQDARYIAAALLERFGPDSSP
ncbi:hypothetical protein B0H16DRAFT_1725235 [Mycena metata]|uniref:Uncharacterized protein n=1 Tax=Mycena metata TaxID=1033252 RepID=A0AAD7IT68_9AGAR|nr:hypothetical protein B0H16DRAFT_1725235 [Mycena metata]